jgi:hypothetical protein
LLQSQLLSRFVQLQQALKRLAVRCSRPIWDAKGIHRLRLPSGSITGKINILTYQGGIEYATTLQAEDSLSQGNRGWKYRAAHYKGDGTGPRTQKSS